ncbi:MAG: hypothetical protein PHS97_00200 [Oscillospiraceae bacterium]|nr:hypothetical protein [Oscillospiraceae bacterium]
MDRAAQQNWRSVPSQNFSLFILPYDAGKINATLQNLPKQMKAAAAVVAAAA